MTRTKEEVKTGNNKKSFRFSRREKRLNRIMSIAVVCILSVGMFQGYADVPNKYEQDHQSSLFAEEDPYKDNEGSKGIIAIEDTDAADMGSEEPDPDEMNEHAGPEIHEKADENKIINEDMVQLRTAAPTPALRGVPAGTTEIRDPWYPSIYSRANEWQIVEGNYNDGQKGASTQVTNSTKSVVIRKNILSTKDENIFTVALKVRTQASWVDLLDATSMRIQNGNSDNSSKVHYFEILPSSSNSVPVDVYFMNAPNNVSESSLPGNYNVVYKKTYYLDPSNSGNWFLYFNNPLIGMGDHGGQKQRVAPGVSYYIPIGTTMQSYEALHHAAVARRVTDTMGPGVSYVEGSARNNTQIPGVNGRTSVSVDGDTLTWIIDDDGTIPVGQDYKLVRDTLNGKTVYYREYDLTYDIHLDASAADFVPGQVYPANESAELDYTYDPIPTQAESDYWNDFEESEAPMVFPIPSVKGTLYNLTFKKTDSRTGDPLSGAEFELSGSYGVTSIPGVNASNGSYYLTEVSAASIEEEGAVTFENLPWGTYDLRESKAPRGWDITFSGITQTLCVTSYPGALEKKGEEYWLKASLIGNNGEISNDTWPESSISLKKNITNYEDILSETDRETSFDIMISDFDPSKVVFLDEEGNIVDDGEKLLTMLKHQESLDLTVRLKNGSGSFSLCEILREDSDLFVYCGTSMDKTQNNTDAHGSAICSANGDNNFLTVNEGNDVILTVNNEYRLGEVLLEKRDSVTGEGLDGAQFDVYTSEQSDANADAETLEISGGRYYKLNRTQTSNTEGKLSFSKLPSSSTRRYIIKETMPPKGYMKMESLIPFTFDADGNSLMGEAEEDLSFDPATNTILVDNHKIYELPSAGGIGTYLFMLVGALIMAVPVINFIRERNRHHD